MSNSQLLLMNYTDIDGQHFGCERVMRVIREGLSARGLDVGKRILVGIPWHKDPTLTGLIQSADILVVNGEGTLHHGKRRGRWLLEAAVLAKRHGARTFLINALWQDNPDDWNALVCAFDKVWCRDSRSAARLSKVRGESVEWFGDLSMCDDSFCHVHEERSGTVFGDSVVAGVTQQLDALSRKTPGTVSLIPLMKRQKFVAPHLHGISRLFRESVAQLATRQAKRSNPKIRFVQSEAEYIDVISRSNLSVTGRYHAVCMAVATQTPFIAVSSNSHKIAALIEDLDLDKRRLVVRSDLTPDLISGEDWRYSPREIESMQCKLRQWQADAQEMFAAIAAGSSVS